MLSAYDRVYTASLHFSKGIFGFILLVKLFKGTLGVIEKHSSSDRCKRLIKLVHTKCFFFYADGVIACAILELNCYSWYDMSLEWKGKDVGMNSGRVVVNLFTDWTTWDFASSTSSLKMWQHNRHNTTKLHICTR
jgi:hypothetical protein